MPKEKVNLGLAEKDRAGAARLLAPLLADEQVLYAKTRNFHWNVEGPHFHDLHKMFEAQYDALAGTIDEIAERIRALGEPAPGSMKEFLALARLAEAPGRPAPGAEMVRALLADHEALARQLRKDLEEAQTSFHDAGTADFLTGLLEEHEKSAWMLRAASA